MRIVGLVFALLVTLSMSAAAQATDHLRSSPGHSSYDNPSTPRNTKPDTSRTATGNPDPYLQRYYSHSEGWTYYNLPPDSTARPSGDQ
jgi:hypothetical protein